MKTRSILAAVLMSLLIATSFAQEAQLTNAQTTQIASFVRANNLRAIAQLVANDPALAVKIAEVAAVRMSAGDAARLAVAITVAAPKAAPQVAAAIARIHPEAAATLAAAVSVVVPEEAPAVAAAVSRVVPAAAPTIVAAVSRVVPAAKESVTRQVAEATNQTEAAMTTLIGAAEALGMSEYQQGLLDAQRTMSLLANIVRRGPAANSRADSAPKMNEDATKFSPAS